MTPFTTDTIAARHLPDFRPATRHRSRCVLTTTLETTSALCSSPATTPIVTRFPFASTITSRANKSPFVPGRVYEPTTASTLQPRPGKPRHRWRRAGRRLAHRLLVGERHVRCRRNADVVDIAGRFGGGEQEDRQRLPQRLGEDLCVDLDSCRQILEAGTVVERRVELGGSERRVGLRCGEADSELGQLDVLRAR